MAMATRRIGVRAMARRSDHLWADSGDDYTPATDLVFSMFAMTVLLLTMFGAGDHIKTVESLDTIKVDRKEINDLRTDIGFLRDENRTLKAQVEKSRLPGPAPSGRVDTLIKMGTVKEAEVGPFMADDVQFSPAVRDRLLALIAQHAGEIAVLQANRLIFEIATSAIHGANEDGVDIDMMETMNWAEALMRAMRRSPLPVGCLAVLPTGKLHSAHLRALTTAPGAGKALDDFESLLKLKRIPASIARELNLAKSEDRHITIWAQRIALGNCDSKVLGASVATLRGSR